jgi:hypothetical protein
VSAGREIQILEGDAGPELAIVEGAGLARAVIWPGMKARARSLHRIQLEDGAGTIDLCHPSDAVYYVIAGTGAVTEIEPPERFDLRAGSMFHVDAGTRYAISAADGGLDLVGGPAPADDAMYESPAAGED